MSCQQNPDLVLQKSKINGVLDQWHIAAAQANFDKYFGLMTDDAVFIGTDATENWSIKLLTRIIPTTNKISGSNFFIKENGIRKATPLFLALVVIEVTDLVFAVDSIPAVFAVTQDAFVAFASNILAILGLRALYFVLADWVTKLRYLKPGLAAILGFIGVKMLLVDFIKIPSWVSLLVIFAVLTTAGLSSWYVAQIETRQKNKVDPFS